MLTYANNFKAKNERNLQQMTQLVILLQVGGKIKMFHPMQSRYGCRILGMIKSSISTTTKEVILNLYKTLIRQRMEYAVQSWSTHNA